MLHPQQWYYTNLTIYESSCKCLMQLNRNSSHKPVTNLSGFFNVLLHGIQHDFDFSFRKKKEKKIFPVVKYLEVYHFQKRIIFNV